MKFSTLKVLRTTFLEFRYDDKSDEQKALIQIREYNRLWGLQTAKYLVP